MKNKSKFLRTVESKNLTKIRKQISRNIVQLDEHLKLTSFNAQSVKNKDSIIRSILDEEQIDVGVTTETWLREQDDENWICSSELNNDGWKLFSVPRKNRTGGGVALVTKLNKVKKLGFGSRNSFEYGIWQVISKNTIVNIIGLYVL